jgi:hypothetical protein
MSQNTPKTRLVVIISISIKTLHQYIHSRYYIQSSIYLSVCLSIYLSIYLSVYLFTLNNDNVNKCVYYPKFCIHDHQHNITWFNSHKLINFIFYQRKLLKM